jgi:hypothetical protein
MSAKEIIAELPKLSSAERLAVQRKLAEIASGNSGVALLHDRGIDEVQAAGLRSRLKTFAEDWERPEAAIYDENPAR